MRFGRVAGVFVAAMLSVIACSPFGSDPSSPSPSADALDAATDASTTGAAPQKDSESDDASPAACAGFELCDGFERDLVEGTTDWKITVVPPDKPPPRIDPTTAASGKRSLAIPLGSGDAVFVAHALAPGLRKLHLSFEMSLDVGTPEAHLLELVFDIDATQKFVVLNLKDGTDLELYDAVGGSIQEAMSVPRPTAGWTQYDLTVDLDGDATLFGPKGVKLLSVHVAPLGVGKPSELRLGAGYSKVGDATFLRFDDVGVHQE